MKYDPDLVKFYNQKHLSKISTKGYYDEKRAFYFEYLETLVGSDRKILDIACNDGTLTKSYKKYGDVMGIDINKDAIQKCRANGVKCLQTPVEGLPKKYDNHFDIIIAGDIIEHVFNTDNFLRNISKRLKKNGVLLLTTANVASFGRRIMLLFGKNPFVEYSTELPNVEINVGHIRYYTVDNMKEQLNHCGYKNIQIFGDRINLTENLFIPRVIARRLPTFARYMHVKAIK
jgi:SAM-dependent methyltransferase